MTGDEAQHAELRTHGRAVRAALSASRRAAASERIVERLLTLPELTAAARVALYHPTGDEVDVLALGDALRARGVATLLPRVEDDALAMVEVTDATPLRDGYLGLREPEGPAVDVATLQAVIVPGVAFDPGGGRLGYGGGYYDRLLTRCPAATRIGVAFAGQVVDEIPRSPHDQPVDVLVTERGVWRTGARR